jgi:S1 RNA binding domain protein
MEIEVGSILTGKVTGITKFGAFVAIAPGKSGLVHISEIANTYVSEVSEFLTVGQEVNVKVISIENGKTNLSIKATLPPAPAQERRPRPATVGATSPRPQRAGQDQNRAPGYDSARSTPQSVQTQSVQDQSGAEPQDSAFEDKLRRFMQDSDNKISSARGYDAKKTPRRRGSK